MNEYLKDSFFDSLYQISCKDSIKIIDEIYKRSKPLGDPKDNASNQLQKVLVFVPAGKYKDFEIIFEFCRSFAKSGLLITKPVPHNVAFSGRQIKYICDLSIGEMF